MGGAAVLSRMISSLDRRSGDIARFPIRCPSKVCAQRVAELGDKALIKVVVSAARA